MIFIGSGSLLWRAVQAATTSRHAVDLVCVGPDESLPPEPRSFDILVSDDVNAEHERIRDTCTDSVVWSINNSSILKAPLVGSDLRIYNIHNGLLPAFRGRPEIAIIHALLAGENTYGATLHEVDLGIDTGRVLDVETFDVGPQDRFQEVMLTGVRACNTLFERSLDAIVDGSIEPLAERTSDSAYYGLDRIRQLAQHRDNPNFERATALGIFGPLYPEIVRELEQVGALEHVEKLGVW